MIELYQGDCLELMKNIPDHSVDMILCDLPYGITNNNWDKPLSFEKLWEQYHRVTKENAAIVLFGQEPFTSKLIMSNLKEFKYIWYWYKHYCRGFLNAKKQPLRTIENIVVVYKKQCTYNPEMRQGELRTKGNSQKQRGNYNDYKPHKNKNDMYYPTNLLDFLGVHANELFHPTQKPVPLLSYLIKTYTNEGDAVLDNCMGSGTTGVACVETGRNFIGIEINQEYFEIAKERITGTKRVEDYTQLTFF